MCRLVDLPATHGVHRAVGRGYENRRIERRGRFDDGIEERDDGIGYRRERRGNGLDFECERRREERRFPHSPSRRPQVAVKPDRPAEIRLDISIFLIEYDASRFRTSYRVGVARPADVLGVKTAIRSELLNRRYFYLIA